MALPTMSGYWSSRKNIYEQAIVRQRNHEDDFRSKWLHTANYFKDSDVRSAKQQAWSSTSAFQDRCTDAYQGSVEKDIKASGLKRRRDKLSAKLSNEAKSYEAELKGYSVDNFDRMETMRSRAESLRSAREEKRQRVAEEKLYQHWKENNPDMREVESRMMLEDVNEKWEEQVQDRDERLASARADEHALEREMENNRQIALEIERQKEEERLNEEKSLKEILKEQMMEFRARETQAKEWKKQQETLLKQKWQLEQLEDNQKRKEEERQKKDLGRALLRQHKAQMMRKSRVIQEELEQDRKLLESLIEEEQEHEALQTARREKAHADAQWMKDVIEEQLQVEKAREAELDMLYQDEAARMWQKRAGEWERERQARNRLMSEVLASRQEQIDNKLEEIRQQQEESLQRREELVQEMEIAQQMTRREQEEEQQNKMTTRVELAEQIQDRRERERAEKKWQQDEFSKEKREEVDYEELLRRETERMRLQGYEARNYGHRKPWHTDDL